MDGKKRRISTEYNQGTTSDGPFQSVGTSIMAVDEVSCREVAIWQELRNLGCWSWMLLQGNINVRTIIITKYRPKLSASAGGAYIQKLQTLIIMNI